MKISAVLPDHIPAIWPMVEPMLQKALNENPGLYTTDDLKQDLLTGTQSLWIMYNQGEIDAACTARIAQYPIGRVLCVEWLGGERMAAWLEEALEMLEVYAADMGCDRVEVYGRKGWKILKKYGWRDSAAIYRKEINREII